MMRPPSSNSRKLYRGLDSRLLTVVLVFALIGMLAWPYLKGELSSAIFRSLGMRLDPTQVSPIDDRRGEHAGRGGDLSTLGFPRWDQAPGDQTIPTSGPDGPYHDRQGRPYRRWQECRGDPHERHHCGPWQYGPAPDDGRDLGLPPFRLPPEPDDYAGRR